MKSFCFDDASTHESASILKEYELHEKVSQFVINKVNSGNPFHWELIAVDDDTAAAHVVVKSVG